MLFLKDLRTILCWIAVLLELRPGFCYNVMYYSRVKMGEY